jgi:hypothetical protein
MKGIDYLMVTLLVIILCIVLASNMKLDKMLKGTQAVSYTQSLYTQDTTIVIFVRESGMRNKEGDHNTAIYSGYDSQPLTTGMNNIAIKDSINLRDNKYYNTPNPKPLLESEQKERRWRNE